MQRLWRGRGIQAAEHGELELAALRLYGFYVNGNGVAGLNIRYGVGEAGEIRRQLYEYAIVLHAADDPGHGLTLPEACGIFTPCAEQLLERQRNALAERIDGGNGGIDRLALCQKLRGVPQTRDTEAFQPDQRRNAAAGVAERAEGRAARDDGGQDRARLELEKIRQRLKLRRAPGEKHLALRRYAHHAETDGLSDTDKNGNIARLALRNAERGLLARDPARAAAEIDIEIVLFVAQDGGRLQNAPGEHGFAECFE